MNCPPRDMRGLLRERRDELSAREGIEIASGEAPQDRLDRGPLGTACSRCTLRPHGSRNGSTPRGVLVVRDTSTLRSADLLSADVQLSDLCLELPCYRRGAILSVGSRMHPDVGWSDLLVSW